MNREYWENELKNCMSSADRCKLASRSDCPEFLLEIMVLHDVESDVIEAGINNTNCKPEIVKQGRIRLDSIMYKSKATTLCPLPWTHLAIQQNGDFRICCQNIYEPFGKLSNEEGVSNVFNLDINQARNCKEIKDLRVSMIKNERNSLCNLCYNEEDLGLNSKRLHMLKIYNVEDFAKNTQEDGSIDTEKFPLRYIDIRFGNLCNLKCRYCGPTDSSLWYEEYAEMSGKEVALMPFYGSKTYEIKKNQDKWTIDSLDFEWYEDEKFWSQITMMIPYIDRYYFTGGEPTINKAHYRLLELIINMGFAKNTVLEYNSNMFAIPEKLYDFWKEFKDVGIGCSIDGIEDMANYLRPPSKWEVLEKNIDRLGLQPYRSIHGSVATTVSVFNILHFLDISKWLLSKKYPRFKQTPSYHMLEGPTHMSVQVLPFETKKFIEDQYNLFYKEIGEKYGPQWEQLFKRNYEGIINYMYAKDSTSLLPMLKHSTQLLDNKRGHSLEKTVPWLYELLERMHNE
jgi:sulfatase maturation enzyme AslB (radical SAM superfamily)